MIEIETLHQLLHYCPETGALSWKERPRSFFGKDREFLRWNGRYAGKQAFHVNSNGYREGMIFRKMYHAHRIAWAMHYGEYPQGFIDHINGVRDDNRICNLRVVTKSENSRNRKVSKRNKSGFNGVAEFKPGRWRAYVGTDDGNLHIGVFYTFEDAVAARLNAQKKHGYHQNHGRSA